MYSFEFDHQARILRVKVSGFWTAEQARSFALDFVKHGEEARSEWDRVRVLLDATDVSVQATAASSEFNGVSKHIITGPHDRLALVISSALVRMQAQRMLDDGKIFTSLEDANAWLGED